MFHYIEGVEHQEAIESIAVARSMNFGLDYVEIDAIEEIANAREQVLLVRRIDQYLDTCSGRCDTRLHHWCG